MPRQIRVTIPATTANLGPGFDCLGMALSLHNEIRLVAIDKGLEVSVTGEGASRLPTDETNLVAQAADLLFQRIGRRPPGLRIVQHNKIPVSSGLGSSAAAVLGGILGANALVDGHFSSSELLSLAAELEGHPDNVAPALHGGLTLINRDEDQLLVELIPVPRLEVVVVLPDFELATSKARSVLPKRVPMSDAIFNAARTALLVRALEAADFARLSVAVQDRLHQPYRLPIIPGMTEAFESARQAGAAAVALSGAGPGVVAFASDGHQAIGQAMKEAFVSAGLPSRIWILPVDLAGSQIESLG